MANNSNSQNSYLILDSLSHGSKYGLEIIEYISQKTGGNVIMKKPSLYSSLTRMEKKGLISSSYWGESEIGGKRHYYNITNSGRQALQELEIEFKDVDFTSISSDDEQTASTANFVSNAENTDISESQQTSQTVEDDKDFEKPVFLQQNNFFDMVKDSPKVEENKTEKTDDVLENQMDIFDIPPQEEYTHETTTANVNNLNSSNITISPNTNQKEEQSDLEKIEYYESILQATPSKELPKDDGKFLDASEQLTEFQTEQNKRLYDTSSELKKYRKKKSFSENQIEMSVVYEKAEDREIQRERIEELKKSLFNSKQNAFNAMEQEKANSTSNPYVYSRTQTEQKIDNSEPKTEIEEPVKDDAVFITNPPIDQAQIPIQKKISPTNIEVNIYDNDLPAPKRDANLEPTYKDMMAKLFERKKEKEKAKDATQTQQNIIRESQTTTSTSFADYDSLKKYYAGHNIEFKEYKKTTVKRHHNTNFLNFITSCCLLLLSGIGCAVLFAIAHSTGNLIASTNFMYYTLPILFLIYTVYTFIRYKLFASKKPNLIYNSIVNWAVCILAIVIIFVVNIICGMQYETIAQYQTSLFVPILAVILIFPINYYIKLFAYKKFGK